MGTAAVTPNSLVGALDFSLIDGGGAALFKALQNDDPDAYRKLAGFNFQVRAETSSNNDPVTVANLNTLGCSWVGDDLIRNVTVKAWWRNVSGTVFGYSEQTSTIKGSAAGSTPLLSTTAQGVPTGSAADQSYRVRSGMLTTTQNTPVYQIAACVISSASVVVRCQGNLAGQDLRWLVEVDVGPLKVLPIAVT